MDTYDSIFDNLHENNKQLFQVELKVFGNKSFSKRYNFKKNERNKK